MAVAAGSTTNPLLLGLLIAVVTLVVVARRGDSPWARSYRLYVVLASIVVVARALLHVLVGLKWGTVAILPLPQWGLPHWAAGIDLLGTVYLEGWLAAILLGAKLGALILAVGAANALANPKRLLRSLPNALHEVGTAVVVSVSVAPQLAESVQRILRARLLRGDDRRGLRIFPRVALPVLQDTLDRSLMLATAMESRGYGRRVDPAGAAGGRWIPVTTGLGLLVGLFGLYGVLDPTVTLGAFGPALLVGGLALATAAMIRAGRSVPVTRYRRDPWLWPETLTVLCGLGAAAGMLITRQWQPALLDQPLQPLAAPGVPVLATLGLLIGGLPAVLTPPPVAGRTR